MKNTSPSNKVRVRILNGYRLIYDPTHPKAMKNKNWDGFIYEHIKVAEQSIGRQMLSTEVVHHLDGNRTNNRYENLLVLDRGQHGKLHKWLGKGAPGLEKLVRMEANSGKPKVREPRFCHCGNTLQEKQKKSCSLKCSGLMTRKVERPSYEIL